MNNKSICNSIEKLQSKLYDSKNKLFNNISDSKEFNRIIKQYDLFNSPIIFINNVYINQLKDKIYLENIYSNDIYQLYINNHYLYVVNKYL